MCQRYIRTPILPQKVQDYLDGKGIGFALVEDCCKAMLLIASDTTINGKDDCVESTLLKTLTDHVDRPRFGGSISTTCSRRIYGS